MMLVNTNIAHTHDGRDGNERLIMLLLDVYEQCEIHRHSAEEL